MNVASLELSKELYELSGWVMPNKLGHQVRNEKGVGTEWWALYDLGYLLRKLPRTNSHYVLKLISQGVESGSYKWCCGYNYMELADTPEDAACKLAIELFKQGVLAKGGDNA